MQTVARSQTVGQPSALRWRDRRGGRSRLVADLEATEREIRKTQAALEASHAAGRPLSPAGAWLLDNVFVVLEQVHEIRADASSRLLPRPAEAHVRPERGLSARLRDRGRVHRAHGRAPRRAVGGARAASFQRVSLLTMGELWAMPAMLRIGFLENVRRMGRRARDEVQEVAAADAWVARLRTPRRETTPHSDASSSSSSTPLRGSRPPSSRGSSSRCGCGASDFTPLLWLEQWIAEDVMTVEEAAQRTTQDLALTQFVIANSIASLRAVPDLEWPVIFERRERQ